MGDEPQDDTVILEDMTQMCSDTVSTLLINNTCTLHNILENINSNSKDRCVDAFDVPIMQASGIKNVLLTDDDFMHNTSTHTNLLQRNLSSFNLKIDSVQGDGDCAFRAIIFQLRKTDEWKERNELLMHHLKELGLGHDIDRDVFELRQLFVDSGSELQPLPGAHRNTMYR